MKNKVKFRQIIQRFYFKIYHAQKLYFEALRIELKLSKRISNNKLIAKAPKDKEYLFESKDFLKRNFNGYANTKYHHLISILRGKKETQIIPGVIFATRIEPVMNEGGFYRAYNDKVSLDLLFRKEEMPQTIFKLIKNQYYDSENNWIEKTEAINQLKQLDCKVVLKPAILSGRSKGVLAENSRDVAEILVSNPGYEAGSFIIQQWAEQHEQMARLHPTSFNTCRIMTARVGSEIVILSSYLQIGVKNNRVDSGIKGGIICGINKEGKLNKQGFESSLKFHETHPDTGFKFHNFSIPDFSKAAEFCIQKHKKLLRFTFVSWDVGISRLGQPILIELNLRKQAIFGHQVINGPLFGKFTDQILKKYQELRVRNAFYI